MAKRRKNDSFGKAVGRALAREGRDIAKGVGKELLSIATLGLYSPKRRSRWKKKT
jgi:hypothetical protein